MAKYENTYAVRVSQRKVENGLSMVRCVHSVNFVVGGEYRDLVSLYVDDQGNALEEFRITLTISGNRKFT